MSSDRKCPDVFEPGAIECLGCPEWLICGWAYCKSKEEETIKALKEDSK